jgi:3-phenylpropionate/trans-cinnamate dioxygenase ferredoxin reductase component
LRRQLGARRELSFVPEHGHRRGRSRIFRIFITNYLHSFWSDQYEHLIEYVGFAASWDRLVVRGHPASRTFLGFYLKDGMVRAAVGLNRGGDPEDSKGDGELKIVANLIRHRVAVDPTRPEDENADLHQLTVAAP